MATQPSHLQHKHGKCLLHWTQFPALVLQKHAQFIHLRSVSHANKVYTQLSINSRTIQSEKSYIYRIIVAECLFMTRDIVKLTCDTF